MKSASSTHLSNSVVVPFVASSPHRDEMSAVCVMFFFFYVLYLFLIRPTGQTAANILMNNTWNESLRLGIVPFGGLDI